MPYHRGFISLALSKEAPMPSITRDSRTISFTDSRGTGTPMVLLHAFPLNSRQWDGQIESLAERFRFIAPDFQGFG